MIFAEKGAPLSHQFKIAMEAQTVEPSPVRIFDMTLLPGAADYCLMVDSRTILHPDAIALFIRAALLYPEAEILFGDEVRLGSDGVIVELAPACEMSEALLYAVNPAARCCLIKHAALALLPLGNRHANGSVDCFPSLSELLFIAWNLRLKFQHLPLYFHGFPLDVSRAAMPPTLAQTRGQALAFPPPPVPEVALVIPFRDRVDYIRRLMDSLAQTAYPCYSVVLINNGSVQPETLAYLGELRPRARVQVIDIHDPFNFSHLYNQAVADVSEELLVFMNNDVEILAPDWLDIMVRVLSDATVALVGCRLIRSDRSLQHGGMVFRPSMALCAMNLFFEDGFYTRAQRDVSGVTAACWLIRKSVFTELGGFDDIQFPIGFSDADLCLKIMQAGHRIVYAPQSVLLHHESASRPTEQEPYEKWRLFQRYAGHSPLVDRHYPPFG